MMIFKNMIPALPSSVQNNVSKRKYMEHFQNKDAT